MTGPPARQPDDEVSARGSEQEARASLRTLRTLLVLCLLVPLLIYGTFAAYRYRQVHEEAEVRLDRALRIANEHALKVLETNETLLQHVNDLAEGLETAPPARRALLYKQLQALGKSKPQIQSIWIIDAQGRPLLTDRVDPPPPGLLLADREYFVWHQARAAQRAIHFSEVAPGRTTGQPLFNVSQSRVDAAGRFAGVVTVSHAPDYFRRFHADLSADEPGLAITMFREDGVVYSRWPPLPSAAPRMSPTSPVLSRVMAGHRSGVIRGVSSLDRQDRLLMFRQVGAYPVYLGTGLELKAIRAAWGREMALLGGFGAVPVGGLLLTGLLAMRRARQSVDAAHRLREEIQARTQMEEALRQAQKMEAVGRLTGGVAHDFNNALMVISANLHMLRRAHPGVGERQADAIDRAVQGATKLTRQLLAFSRRQALMPQVVRLQEQLPLLRDLVAPVLGSQVSVAIEVHPDTAPVKVDIAELELALLNLAVNAKDAMPQGGSFRIAARNAPRQNLLHVPAVEITAADSGSGIPPDVLPRVFEPFYTTKAIGQGTCLGLSQVYGFCQRSGGTARIRSEVGIGTEVDMLFPAAEGAASGSPAAAAAQDESLGLRVLLVEDNPDVAAAIRPMLESLGCEVTHHPRADSALAWLEAHPDAVDVVLTDVVMPGEMDGLDLAQAVRQRLPRLGLVVMTGYAERIDEVTRQGFTVLAKPWTVASLLRTLREMAPLRSR